MISEFSGDNRWLSNFWLCPIMKGEWVYPSTENAYQAAKYPKAQRSLFVNVSPSKAKEYGQQVERPKNWDTDKLVVMRQVLEQKFRVGTYNAVLLSNTGTQEIIEGNTWGDVFWGICDGVGENHLGRMLMEIRDSITQ